MTEELIDRFFNKQCTPQESAEVVAFLENNPHILEKYSGRHEWEATEDVNMDNEFWNDVWTRVKKKRRKAGIILYMKKVAVAASIVFIIGVGYNLFYTKKQQPLISSSDEITKREQKIMLNNSAEIMIIALPDSSQVVLSPGSVIVYYIPFDVTTRDISLDGKARFKVMKDELRPFTVYAGGLATTALGTEFTISTHEKTNNNITVKLHTGKVVIKGTGNTLKALNRHIYLEPGQQLEFNEMSMNVEVSKIKNEELAKVRQKENKGSAMKSKKAATVSEGLSFVNTALPEVMRRLSDYYKKKIEFDRKEIDSMNFTGTISENDSLHLVLKVISQMNDLEMIKNEDGYTLKRLQQ